VPISRESGCVNHVGTLWRRRRGQLATESTKRVRGLGALLLVRACRSWQETSEGTNPKGASGWDPWLNPKACVRDLRDEQSPEAAMRRSRRIQSREGHGAREGVRRSGGRKAPKGKPHGRNQDEISLEGREGSKASQGCETPRTQLNP